MYGVTSAILGAAATPVYWAFMDPTSPVGGIFFALSTVLLAVGLVRPEAGRSEGRSSSDWRSPATGRAR